MDSSITNRCFIPGLVQEMYIAASVHTAPTPTLVKSNITRVSLIDFEWHAHGSKVYKVTAIGSISLIKSRNTFKVRCTCPSGAEQHMRNETREREVINVCKHAKSALDSVLDISALDGLEDRKQAAEAQNLIDDEHLKEHQKAVKQQQEKELPGERTRIGYGLHKLTAKEVVEILEKKLETVAGLHDLTQVFPVDVMPQKKNEQCARCNNIYDPQIRSDRMMCRITHPCDKVQTEWDGSSRSWSHCRQCSKDFDFDGFHRRRKRGRNDVPLYDGGEFCWKGEHVSMADFDPETDPGVFDQDVDDY